jgi:hypothetical protein
LNSLWKVAFQRPGARHVAAEIAGLFRTRWVVPCRPVPGRGAVARDLRRTERDRWRHEWQTLKTQDFLPAPAPTFASFPGRIRRVAQGLPGGELNDDVGHYA